MATNTPDSFFAKQGSTQEEAQHTQPDPVYLSEDSGPEEEPTFTSGAPGFSSLSSFISSAYQNPAFELRQQEIESMNTPIIPEEDKKLPPSPSSSSKHESDSEFEIESEVEKKAKPKSVKLVSKALRVKRNVEHGLNKPSKKPKKMELWEYTDQKLSPDLMLQILPTPTDSFVFRKAMTMKEVEKEVSTQNIDNTLLSVLNKFSAPLCTTIKLSDIQTERSGFLMFRRVVVRKRLGPGQYSYAVMPNLVISSKKKVYHKAQGVWYEKSTTNNRSKEMAIPKPFQGNQSVDVLFDNTFSWDV